ncbi:MAG: hypothetical protein AAF495_16980 [Pseudomonadota bacterium]
MNGHAVQRLFAALALASLMALGAPASGHAGQGGAFNHGDGLKVRVARPHGGGFKPFGHKRFNHRGFNKRFFFFPRTTTSPQPVARPTPRSVARIPPPPPTPGPKWIHVGPDGGDGLLGGTILAKADGTADCLSVTTEILLDDQPVAAFGTACRQADGSWRLQPANQAAE